ncbi:bifunctional serine/threonine-protein kinase/formylglycine-generating enzyme family protein [Desulfomonile tiedjei]|uniref:Serine/threonine protein kinase n=1 Tax=Desulfomonile tiedjei (strain ATCC 49306 / DSM 6799 / DCB-1) TaxID=706587 RepID=I4C5X1_DESTA|nr:bifunctional serine/threonine-protein kinase/formylglycine-generating enzyme family protein [Desulfomonile tiedjei]AFM24962.1 serine/threonine protein kinase [Desulfomonile tiedjei DSM 6799]
MNSTTTRTTSGTKESVSATTSSRTKKPLLKVGTVLNEKWEILQHIATGGKGEVYRARQTNLNREVVVKIVSVEYLAEFGDDPEEVNTEIQRFHREALAMAQIRHPYVAQVYDQDAAVISKNGEEITVQYVVMEYVPGGRTLRHTMPFEGYRDERDLRQWIRTYFLPIFDGLETVHALGIVHRDMKPENVLLDGQTPKIIDFGIAGGPAWSQLTKSHHVEGTITYMAPEQFMDLAETDGRADVYALGKMLYEAVQGKMVDSKTACPLKGVCLANPSTPFLKELDPIIQQATAEDKEKRIPSVSALRESLERLLEKTEASERPLFRGLHRKQIIAIIVVLFIIVAVSNIYHHFIMTHEVSMPSHVSTPEVTQPTESEKTSERAIPEYEPAVPTLTAKDGTIMHLVPAGQVKLPSYVGAEGGKVVEVPPFYIDETEVTNFKYVEFLNQVLSKVEVKDGIVRVDGQPWLVLGPVYSGYEPIVYRNGRFLLQDEGGASHPVVKVTGFGAAAYATFYGERLPTETEWLRAASRPEDALKKPTQTSADPARDTDNLEKEMEAWAGAFKEETSSGDASPERSRSISPKNEGLPDSSENQGASTIPYPVLSFEPNVDGIRGLMRNVSEWGVRLGVAPNAKPQFVVLGGMRGTMLAGSTPIPGIAQDPSMAFEDVGFRCAKNIDESGR